MARPKRSVDALLIERAQVELKSIKDSRVSIRLKAIIASGTHTVKDVAEIFQVSSVSIFQWIKLFKKYGGEGLRDRPKGHMKSKLTDEHKERILNWIERSENSRGEKIIWTLDKLRREIKKVFNIKIGRTPLWIHLKKMGLVLRRPRPVHNKADKALQEAFKKNERTSR